MARMSGRRSGRGGPRPSARQGRQKSTSTGLIVGGAAGGVVALVALVSLSGGLSRRSRGRSHSAPSVSNGRISPEEARRLKREGIDEMQKGFAIYRRARPGAPGEQTNLAAARRHLEAATDLFLKAQEGLPGDTTLDTYAQQCNEKRYDCMKRAAPGR